MKIFKTILLLTFAILVLLSSNSCTDCINGSGSTVTIDRPVTGFTSISFGLEGTIYISQDTITTVTITSQHDIADDIITEVHGGELNISSSHCIRGNSPITIFITTPDLNGVHMDGSGDMYVTGNVEAEAFDVTLGGSGNIHISDSIIAPVMSVGLSGSGNIDLWAFCNTMNSTISGSGNITMNGAADSHTSSTSGSGNIHAYGLITSTTNVSISGSGSEELFVNELLDVTISGSGNVYYKGDATVTTHISGSGGVIHVN
ncbi:MAG: head GIN domain-containing protein [Chitinophagales bacterium]